MTISFDLKFADIVAMSKEVWRYFIGAVSPRGHMLPMLVGAARLVDAAQRGGGKTIIYDTSGLVNPTQGGMALKMAKIELLKPSVIVAIQCEQELEPILLPRRRSRRVKVIDLNSSPAVIPRDSELRRAHRAKQFKHYFSTAKELVLDWNSASRLLAVFPWPHFSINCLVGLEDQQGYLLGLGIVIKIDRDKRTVTLLTPILSIDHVNAVKLGDIMVKPNDFIDQPIG
jgi:polynucleotide 5'-hydroxyl-kinase GRC3/NOL9